MIINIPLNIDEKAIEEAIIQLRLGPGVNEDVSEEYNDAVNIAIELLEQRREIPTNMEQVLIPKYCIVTHDDAVSVSKSGYWLDARQDTERIDRLTKIIMWLLKRYHESLEKIFEEELKQVDEILKPVRLMDLIYAEQCKVMPKPLYEYGFDDAESEE